MFNNQRGVITSDNLALYIQFFKNYINVLDTGNLDKSIDLYKFKDCLGRLLLDENIYGSLNEKIKEIYQMVISKYSFDVVGY